MRVLQLVHGFPPREQAGTEVYAARLAEGLRARGHSVLTVAVAPDPGAPMWQVHRGYSVVRVVNNAPYAGLRTGASDAHFDRLFSQLEAEFEPDLVHVQHLIFASATLRARAPVVWTLHDAWAWCAAGGQLLRDGAPCAGPDAGCAACASGWAKDSPAQIRTLKLAASLGRFVEPARLQALWRRLPSGARALTNGPAAPLTGGDLARRTANIRAFASACTRIVSPSRWFADTARANGIAVTDVIPHGVDPIPSAPRTGPFVFLGTLAWHKGPDLVQEAWRRAQVTIPLRIHGRPGPDPRFTLVNDGPLTGGEVRTILGSARALVLGSRWPENAPLVALEARAAGCPVIAPAIGGIPEIVEEGRDGWLYPPGDVDALADRLRAAAATERIPRPPPTFAAHLDAVERVYGECGRATGTA